MGKEWGVGLKEDDAKRSSFHYEAWSAFPSDQASMMFALATGFWFASRPAGILVAIFSVMPYSLAYVSEFIILLMWSSARLSV